MACSWAALMGLMSRFLFSKLGTQVWGWYKLLRVIICIFPPWNRSQYQPLMNTRLIGHQVIGIFLGYAQPLHHTLFLGLEETKHAGKKSHKIRLQAAKEISFSVHPISHVPAQAVEREPACKAQWELGGSVEVLRVKSFLFCFEWFVINSSYSYNLIHWH